MKDPRLLEIEFLASLEREGPKGFQLSKDDIEQQFLVYELLSKRWITQEIQLISKIHYSNKRVEANADNAMGNLFHKCVAVSLQITHRGRVRLWRLRDELLSNPDRDPRLDLLSARSWERDIPVHLIFASAEQPVTVLMADLDHFKEVNDKHGHEKGNAVLAATVAVINDAVLGHGNAYRYGGEEFGIILTGASKGKAHRLAEQIRAGIAANVNREAEMPAEWRAQTVSIGGAIFTKQIDSKLVLDKVDKLLYQAKDNGRNRVVWATDEA